MRICLIGATGKMGKTIYDSFKNNKQYRIVAAIARESVGKDLGLVLEGKANSIIIRDKVDDIIEDIDVFLDFSSSEFILKNIEFIARLKKPIVIGSTGYLQKDIEYFEKLAMKYNTTIFLIPNFSVGAVLLIMFAKQAAKFFNNVEIIEYHHTDKLDAPSGTALLTAKEIASVKDKVEQKESKEKLKGSRGGIYSDIHIHSVRLPSLVAHQEVFLSDENQMLTIRHDSFSRKSFIKGIEFVLSKVSEYNGFIYGMQILLEELI